MAYPITDITSINAVESLWHDGPFDPWGARLGARLADLIVWHDTVRYFLPVRDVEAGVVVPGLIDDVLHHDSNALEKQLYQVTGREQIDPEFVQRAFTPFHGWVTAQGPERFLAWCQTHRQAWVREGHRRRIMHGTVYPVEAISNLPGFKEIESFGLDGADVRYAFDVSLRYLLTYGPRVGEAACYYSHPVREGIRWPADVESFPPTRNQLGKRVAVSLGPYVYQCLAERKWSRQDYADFIGRARDAVRKTGLLYVQPDDLPEGKVAELALALKIPPTLRGFARIGGGMVAWLGVAALLPVVGPAAVAVGAVVGVAATIWTGNLPAGFCRQWLQPILTWDLKAELPGGDHQGAR